jgi:hypothetical protein
MKRFISLHLVLAAGVALMGLASARAASADVHVQLQIGDAPPPPHVVFVREPHVVYVPEERVYVVDDPYAGDHDYFRYGTSWYVFTDGYWYRAASWRGPFFVVEPRYVPTAIYHVPPGHWKHRAVWMPPGQAKKMAHAEYDNDDNEGDHDHGHGHEHGHGHGHEKGPHLY